MLNGAAEYIQNYLRKELPTTFEKAFKVYLPQGQVSSYTLVPKKKTF